MKGIRKEALRVKMRYPNLFIIGAPRCGTTSLSSWLAEHPQIYFSPIKEPFFFSTDVHKPGVSSFEEYMSLFAAAKPSHKYIAEGSTSYLFSRIAVPKIEKLFPGSKYIVMVRSPVEMAISLYALNRTIGEENIEDFEKAWRLSPKRRHGEAITRFCRNPKQLDYQNICKLGEQIERLFTVVPRERVHVVILDDMKRDPRSEYVRVLKFLGLPDDGRQQFDQYNRGTYPRWPAIQPIVMSAARLVKQVAGFIGLKVSNTGLVSAITTRDYRKSVRVSKQFLEELLEFYGPDVNKLSVLLGRDLSEWLNPCQYLMKPWVDR